MKQNQIEQHLKSAVDTLIPDVFDKIDLSAVQDKPEPREHIKRTENLGSYGGMRGMVLAAAACLCLVAGGGGALQYQYQNRKVDSVIGIDVNPSVELSINRKMRVLSAEALNADAEQILSDMDLRGTELNVAVNAVIGAMMTEGYLDDLDNAILVTVNNDSIRKASELRASVVGGIEKTLEENQVQAVVYDQQVVEKDEMKELAQQYGISYGKAYFLRELIEQNKELTMDDMGELSSMTMEEIAKRIAEKALTLGTFTDQVKETTQAAIIEEETTAAPETTQTVETETSAGEPAVTEITPVLETTAVPEATQTPETMQTQEEVTEDRVEIDYVDYEDGMIYVYFVTKVTWKNPTVSVRDEEGNSYAAYVEDTGRDDCTIAVSDLPDGGNYTFVLGGLTPKEGGGATTVKGYFEKPEIAAELTGEEEEEPKEESKEETKEETEAGTAAVPESAATEESIERTLQDENLK